MVKAMRHLWFQYALAAPGLGPRLLAGGQQRLATWILRFFELRPIPDEDVAAYLAVLREPARARAGSAVPAAHPPGVHEDHARGLPRTPAARAHAGAVRRVGPAEGCHPASRGRRTRLAARVRTRRRALPRRRPAGGGGSSRGSLPRCVTRGGAVWNLPFREWRNSAFGDRVAQTGRPVGWAASVLPRRAISRRRSRRSEDMRRAERSEASLTAAHSCVP
jgi:hypothetical protein